MIGVNHRHNSTGLMTTAWGGRRILARGFLGRPTLRPLLAELIRLMLDPLHPRVLESTVATKPRYKFVFNLTLFLCVLCLAKLRVVVCEKHLLYMCSVRSRNPHIGYATVMPARAFESTVHTRGKRHVCQCDVFV